MHRADRAAVVRQVLEEAGVQVSDRDRCAAEVLAPDGEPDSSGPCCRPVRPATTQVAKRITNKDRDRIVELYVSGMSFAEVADETGVARSTAMRIVRLGGSRCDRGVSGTSSVPLRPA